MLSAHQVTGLAPDWLCMPAPVVSMLVDPEIPYQKAETLLLAAMLCLALLLVAMHEAGQLWASAAQQAVHFLWKTHELPKNQPHVR
jgi:hypothetical protein